MPDGYNTFDYEAVTVADRAKLRSYLDMMVDIDPTKLTEDQKFAYLANLYNALTLEVMLEHYPVDSIKEIEYKSTGEKIEEKGIIEGLAEIFTNDGPWGEKLITVNGMKLSLNDIEHTIMRQIYDEPRIHYAVNCASVSCPNLRTAPWVAKTLDADLDDAAEIYIAHPRGVRLDDDGELIASSIYDWYKVDFGGTDADVIAHMLEHAKGAKATMLKGKTEIADFEYDWDVNKPKEEETN